MTTHSEAINEIAVALSKCQAQLGAAAKNKSGYNYQYADLESVWDAAKAPLTANGLSITQHPTSQIVEKGLLVTVDSILMHTSGQWISSSISWLATDLKPQSLGILITYLRRYSFNAIVGVFTGNPENDGELEIERQKTPVQGIANKVESVKRSVVNGK